MELFQGRYPSCVIIHVFVIPPHGLSSGLPSLAHSSSPSFVPLFPFSYTPLSFISPWLKTTHFHDLLLIS